MSVTIKKIAEVAGVSIGTVDRALHGRKGVNPKIAERVLSIADSLGYKPNIHAKALAIKASAVKLGVILNVQTNPFYKTVLDGVAAAADNFMDFGITVSVKCSVDFDPDDQLRLIDEMVDEGISALIIVPINNEKIARRINSLRENNIPVVFLVSELENTERLAYVGCDFNKVGRIAAGLTGMVSGGAGNVLYATSSLSMLSNKNRLQGFRNTLQERYPRLRLMDVCEFENDDIIAYKKAVNVFRACPDIDVIMLVTGSVKGICQALDESPLSGRVKVIAQDLAKPVLDGIQKNKVTASIVQHPYLQGYNAVKLLCDYFVFEKKPSQDKCYVDCEIKIYESLY